MKEPRETADDIVLGKIKDMLTVDPELKMAIESISEMYKTFRKNGVPGSDAVQLIKIMLTLPQK